jgi:transposase-like protein
MNNLEEPVKGLAGNFYPEETGGRRPEVDEGDKLPAAPIIPPTEVKVDKKRRNFTTSYKLKILNLADNCSKDGDLGALLRKEGLYSSHLYKWRKQRQKAILDGLSSQTPGSKPKDQTLLKENKYLKHENDKLKKQLEKASLIIEFQKKTSALLQMIGQEEEKR